MKTMLECGALAACAVLLVRQGAFTVAALGLAGGPLLAGLGMVVGWAAADLACGLVHWLCDTFLDEDTPLVGAAVIQPFREHHRDPLAITRRPVAEVSSYNGAAVVGLLLVAGWLAPGPPASAPAAFGAGFFLMLGLGIAVTNQLHRWAHAPAAPAAVRWAQRRRLVLPPAMHARHHRRGRGAYCVTSGWLNALLDRTQILERLEAAVRAPEAAGVRRRARERP